MAAFHPDETLLMEYAAGATPKAVAICVSAHLSYCQRCRVLVERFNRVGGEFLADTDSDDDRGNEALLARTLAALDARPAHRPQVETPQEDNPGLPPLVNRLLAATPDARWRRLSSSVQFTRLRAGQRDFEVALHRIRAGGSTPRHDHGGDEFTVILTGSFSDEHGLYRPGDFLHRRPGDVHQPRVTQNEDCICLSAVSAPIRLQSRLGWALRPWLRIRPM